LPPFYPVMGDKLRDRIIAFKSELECNVLDYDGKYDDEHDDGEIYRTITGGVYYFICFDKDIVYTLQLHGLGHIEYVTEPLSVDEVDNEDIKVKNKDILIIK